MNLEKLNVTEMSKEETIKVDGGIGPLAIGLAVAFFLLGTTKAY
ncbi:class IIb bacteriocin, lactobin A/cerein 7B family [Ornithobacterium rhinotracheale]|nr:class IIb bacteriocin, lactobin A/cerein 7B family [Ornithobacterium rhinotracheale]MRJ11617.1 class IIb bacteriocin, lactobin A/cerein 7B family [Ornithobacterium rhinotracheale]